MSMGFISVPLVVFMIVVAPLWLILHYRSKRQAGEGLSGEDQKKLETLVARAEDMQERIVTLERILDAEVPRWRQK
ncbi:MULTISPECIES: envelope stress response membrane protein PspB [Photobacterium]|uniref:Phage shock protein B n=3 Tax=Photobacterium leiognathi TaxID=553611 RepID=A0A0U1P6D2_PHOLE|nr:MULTISPECIES: envelope stress response membrane protein PspB [Photobacterium]MBP2700652.1 envelope stress response membrane protein PspB [Vibrio parahaemolyticus]KJF91233.1 phage-shock protein [Photobacterium leiognathi]KJF97622.1 phage-shock protein [Photobacterium leiognathi]KPA52361.1 phage-shock protein [Photobacterium leiognathi subsp. mandapamensis]MCG3885783.1 envelope stress response membrane protein PspB [Photobacterium leiognathi]